jgi:hypothetical protein
MDMRALLIGALIVAVVVLAYLYYESQKNTIEVDIGALQSPHQTSTGVTRC